MKRLLIDEQDNIVYEGKNASAILRILNAGIDEVTEEDEVLYEAEFRPLIGKGNLRLEVRFDLKFKGLDDWDRPVFKDVDSSLYFGDTDFLYIESGKEVTEYYRENPNVLEYFGTSFNCEPNGGRNEYWKFNILG